MKRRDFLKTSAMAAGSALLGPHPAGHAGDWMGDKLARKRPNVLFIVTDQQHAGMMSYTGNPWLRTPAMDSIAASGVRFERAYASNPVCMPSRFSLQTGRMPSAIELGTNDDTPKPRLTESIRTQSLGHVFSAAGYETAYGGKVHLPRGMTDVAALGYRNLTGDSREGLADACAAFIREKRERPFFLFASFINPHDICYMAINALRRVEGKEPVKNRDSETVESVLEQARGCGELKAFVEQNCPPLPGNLALPEHEPECIARKYVDAVPFRAYVRERWGELEWRLHRWAYCRLTEKVDGEIGKVLGALREGGLLEDTLIVFTSDHGDMDAAHRLEHKSVLYEEAVHIPLMLSWPGTIPAATIDSTHIVSNGLDLFPTLCDYAGIRRPAGLLGTSLTRLAAGKAGAWRDYVVVESQNGRMFRTERYKYCLYDSGENREQLTDMQRDPGEMENLAGRDDMKAVLKQYRKRLRKWVANSGDSIASQYVL